MDRFSCLIIAVMIGLLANNVDCSQDYVTMNGNAATQSLDRPYLHNSQERAYPPPAPLSSSSQHPYQHDAYDNYDDQYVPNNPYVNYPPPSAAAANNNNNYPSLVPSPPMSHQQQVPIVPDYYNNGKQQQQQHGKGNLVDSLVNKFTQHKQPNGMYVQASYGPIQMPQWYTKDQGTKVDYRQLGSHQALKTFCKALSEESCDKLVHSAIEKYPQKVDQIIQKLRQKPALKSGYRVVGIEVFSLFRDLTKQGIDKTKKVLSKHGSRKSMETREN